MRTDLLVQSTGFNFAGLMVARIGLGVFEAGFGPGIPLYMCTLGSVGLHHSAAPSSDVMA